jgi:hypothetical protein
MALGCRDLQLSLFCSLAGFAIMCPVARTWQLHALDRVHVSLCPVCTVCSCLSVIIPVGG